MQPKLSMARAIADEFGHNGDQWQTEPDADGMSVAFRELCHATCTQLKPFGRHYLSDGRQRWVFGDESTLVIRDGMWGYGCTHCYGQEGEHDATNCPGKITNSDGVPT